MVEPEGSVASIRHYFVDEAGDGTLFDKKGRIIIGSEGCSKFFLLGYVDVFDPDTLAQELEELRSALLADPYFKNVPSMQPECRKTALAFHAKDDLPEVKREVFRLLMRHNIRFHAVVRNKYKVIEYVRYRNQTGDTYRYNPSELYDYLVRCLFKQSLHKDDSYQICFAKRGSSGRTVALRQALETTRERFCKRMGITSCAEITITAALPWQASALQAADYCLWALQRFYERREDRYIELVWPSVAVILDLDDTRRAVYGAYYTKKKPLTLAALEDLPGI